MARVIPAACHGVNRTAPLFHRSLAWNFRRAAGGKAAPIALDQREPSWKLATAALHADDHLADIPDVAPSINVSATYLYDTKAPYIYSRYSTPARDRTEAVLGAIEGGYATLYSSGLSAVMGALFHFAPSRVAIRGGYFGTHEVIASASRLKTMTVIDVNAPLQAGDLVWVETPMNPCNDIYDIAAFAAKARAAGAKLLVDGTFAPPPLQFPLRLGADMVLHSATKYLGGHSDLLMGALITTDLKVWEQLQHDRSHGGGTPGSLESWLLLRSLRTLEVRVQRVNKSAERVAQYLRNEDQSGHVRKVHHASLPDHPGHTVAKKQMHGGFGAVVSIELDSPELAERLPHALRLFHNATSLGGVESLAEWRHRADKSITPNLVRLSIGLEDPEDLIRDLDRALRGTTQSTL